MEDVVHVCFQIFDSLITFRMNSCLEFHLVLVIVQTQLPNRFLNMFRCTANVGTRNVRQCVNSGTEPGVQSPPFETREVQTSVIIHWLVMSIVRVVELRFSFCGTFGSGLPLSSEIICQSGLLQTTNIPDKNAFRGARTPDRWVKSPTLYRLS